MEGGPLPPVTLIMFHDVRPASDPLVQRFPARYAMDCFLNPEQLDAHLDEIQQHFQVVSLGRVRRAAKGLESLPPNPAVLTFDDGRGATARGSCAPPGPGDAPKPGHAPPPPTLPVHRLQGCRDIGPMWSRGCWRVE